MSRATWHNKIAAKLFHVHYYRKLAKFLIYINIINLGLLIAMGLIFVNRGVSDYYASNGYMPPIVINAMDAANESSEPLLPVDNLEVIKPKAIVQ